MTGGTDSDSEALKAAEPLPVGDSGIERGEFHPRVVQIVLDHLLAEGGAAIEPVKLVAPMLERFIATDRGFAKARRPKT